MNSGRKDMTVPVTTKDLIIVNMGPHHLSMHGVLLLTLDGEDVIDCEPILGLGRGMEKITENRMDFHHPPIHDVLRLILILFLIFLTYFMERIYKHAWIITFLLFRVLI